MSRMKRLSVGQLYIGVDEYKGNTLRLHAESKYLGHAFATRKRSRYRIVNIFRICWDVFRFLLENYDEVIYPRPKIAEREK